MFQFRSLIVPVAIGVMLSPALLLRSSAAEDQVATLEASLNDLKAKWEVHHQEREKTLEEMRQEVARKEREYAIQLKEVEEEANKIRNALCEAGNLYHCPEAQGAKNIDIVKLAKAVATAETDDCNAGVGRAPRNNCFGIKRGGEFVTYESKAHAYRAFMAMWLRVYGDQFPTPAMASRYTAHDYTDRWLGVVTVVYNRD